MTKRPRTIRWLLLGPALPLLWLSAVAQVATPGSADPAVSGPTAGDPFGLALLDTRQAADTQFASGVKRQRELNPDLGRVLGVDAASEEKLLELLDAEELARKIVDPRLGTQVEQQAQQYNERMREISQLIGVEQIDTWLEYHRTRASRLRVQLFDASLPAGSRLSSTQKDAFVALLGAAQEEPGDPTQRWLELLQKRMRDSLTPASKDELLRDMQRIHILFDEQEAQRLASANLALLPKLTAILNAEQLRIYVQRQAEQVAGLRAQARRQRIHAGFRPNEPLAVADLPVAAFSADLQLQLRVRIDGIEIQQTLSSARGELVTFEGPQGLTLEAQPRLHDSGQLLVELNVYESTRAGLRLVGRAETGALVTNPSRQPVYPGLGTTNKDWLLRGRKAYVLDWEVKATYL